MRQNRIHRKADTPIGFVRQPHDKAVASLESQNGHRVRLYVYPESPRVTTCPQYSVDDHLLR